MTDAFLAALISKHAPHGFGGSMRSPKEGCSVYVAAVALDEALRWDECPTSPGRGASDAGP